MSIIKRFFSAVLLCAAFTGCMQWDYADNEDFDISSPGLFIINEGNFQYGNSTLSFYNTQNEQIDNEIFYRANGMKLGDVAHSMTYNDGKCWIVVNNSHVVFAIDADTFRELGRIDNLTSPRYIHFVDPHKAYISQLWDNRIAVVDPSRYVVVDYIEVPEMEISAGSTEQMVSVGSYVYCTCWSYQNRIIKIDTHTDQVVASLCIGIQPSSIVADCHNRLWVITDGGYDGSPYGYEAPALYCINTEHFKVEKMFQFQLGDSPRSLAVNTDGNTLYWINDGVWSMDVDSPILPSRPLIDSRQTKYYALTVSPLDNDLFVADAIDYQQQGIIYRFTAQGSQVDKFYVGVTPGAFCWKP